jgi:hypothetical protein
VEEIMKAFTGIVLSALLVASTAVIAAEVDNRLENQQDRIQQGEKSGQLTNGEAKTLNRDDKAIHNEVRADRAANGGKLTKGEKKTINRQENRVSHKIYRKKHNNRTKPGVAPAK